MTLPIRTLHHRSTPPPILPFPSGMLSHLRASILPVLQNPAHPRLLGCLQPEGLSLPSLQTLSPLAVLLKAAPLPASFESGGAHLATQKPPEETPSRFPSPAVVMLSEATFQVPPHKSHCIQGHSEEEPCRVEMWVPASQRRCCFLSSCSCVTLTNTSKSVS